MRPSLKTLAALALLVLMVIASASASSTTQKERFASAAAAATPPPSSAAVKQWDPARPGYEDDAPRPLLDLALSRIAAERGAEVRAAIPHTVEVRAAYRERLPIDVVADAAGRDRWYRWSVVGCFYRVGEPYGACEVMDVRARTGWTSGTPPTAWPIEVASRAPAGGPPVPTSKMT